MVFRVVAQSLFAFLPPESSSSAAANGDAALPDGASLRLGFRHSLKELQEKQSPLRSPRGRASSSPMASREASPVGHCAASPRTPLAAETPTQQQLSSIIRTGNEKSLLNSTRQHCRSPVRQAPRRRGSSQSASPVSSRRRCSAVTASAALAAADAAAAATPSKPKGGALAAAGTPSTRRAVLKAEKELRGLAFGASGPPSAAQPVSQHAT